ncbi:MAG TPA: hypothetical protein VJM77_00535 [Nitrospiria bacterium]|jgi:hypothetical protein|nr:hypothetical protein [Nitrospiria bacterium]
MKDIAIQERIRLMEKEMDLLGESIESMKMDLREQVARLRIDLGTLKAFLMQVHPVFKTKYPRIKKMVTAKVDPDRLD